MMKELLFIAACVFIIPAHGQDKGRVTSTPKKQPEKKDLISDVFKGSLHDKDKKVTTQLVLQHKLYSDDGKFAIDEIVDGLPKKATGEWTVLRGDAKDENATVVELDIPGRMLYFLRRKNGDLQKLDTALREIKPVEKYVLHKQK